MADSIAEGEFNLQFNKLLDYYDRKVTPAQLEVYLEKVRELRIKPGRWRKLVREIIDYEHYFPTPAKIAEYQASTPYSTPLPTEEKCIKCGAGGVISVLFKYPGSEMIHTTCAWHCTCKNGNKFRDKSDFQSAKDIWQKHINFYHLKFEDGHLCLQNGEKAVIRVWRENGITKLGRVVNAPTKPKQKIVKTEAELPF